VRRKQHLFDPDDFGKFYPGTPAGKLAIKQIEMRMETVEEFIRTASRRDLKALLNTLEDLTFH
jgi:hypothetical protein